MLGDLERVHQQHTVDAAIGQRQRRRIDERRGRVAVGRPVHHALLGRHEGQHPHRFGAVLVEVGRGVADAQHRMAVAGIEARARDAPDEPPRHLTERRGVERAQVGDIQGHGNTMARRAQRGASRAPMGSGLRTRGGRTTGAITRLGRSKAKRYIYLVPLLPSSALLAFDPRDGSEPRPTGATRSVAMDGGCLSLGGTLLAPRRGPGDGGCRPKCRVAVGGPARPEEA